MRSRTLTLVLGTRGSAEEQMAIDRSMLLGGVSAHGTATVSHPLMLADSFSSAPPDRHALTPGASLSTSNGPVHGSNLLDGLGSVLVHAPHALDPLLAIRDLIVPLLHLLGEEVEVVPGLLDALHEEQQHRPRDEGPLVGGVPGMSHEIHRSAVRLAPRPCPHHHLPEDEQQHEHGVTPSVTGQAPIDA